MTTAEQSNHNSPELDLEHFLPYRLSVLSNLVSSAIAAEYAERYALGMTEWRVIAVIGPSPGLSASEVVERTAMDKVAVSRAVDRLVKSERLSRHEDSHDRRRSQLRLSRARSRGVERAHGCEARRLLIIAAVVVVVVVTTEFLRWAE